MTGNQIPPLVFALRDFPFQAETSGSCFGLIEIAIHKPNATAKTVTLALVEGTKQEIPADAHSLLQVVRNVDATTGGYNLQIAWSTGALAGRSI